VLDGDVLINDFLLDAYLAVSQDESCRCKISPLFPRRSKFRLTGSVSERGRKERRKVPLVCELFVGDKK